MTSPIGCSPSLNSRVRPLAASGAWMTAVITSATVARATWPPVTPVPVSMPPVPASSVSLLGRRTVQPRLDAARWASAPGARSDVQNGSRIFERGPDLLSNARLCAPGHRVGSPHGFVQLRAGHSRPSPLRVNHSVRPAPCGRAGHAHEDSSLVHNGRGGRRHVRRGARCSGIARLLASLCAVTAGSGWRPMR
jgi:hypothetical protein